MKASLIPPKEPCMGNLLWNIKSFKLYCEEIKNSLEKLRSLGYWASAFPEGDGVAFKHELNNKSDSEMLADFQMCFDWVEIFPAKSNDSNEELAELETDRELRCIVIVPLEKIFIEETFEVGPYKFFCRRQFDKKPFDRYADYESEYLQFETLIFYKDLLRLNRNQNYNDQVIGKCISLAEHALDMIRYQYSSFTRKEFTPNPAGQIDNGFFSIKIIPNEFTHIKSTNIIGIPRPLSVSNNWLGPQVEGLSGQEVGYLALVHSGLINDQMSLSVVGALRSCRQSFYSLGSESQYLNLIFTLDGLVNPANWKGWKHRTYVSALLSGGNSEQFEKILPRYNYLYSEIRNRLVHEGKDFYELEVNSDELCDELYEYIKKILKLIVIHEFKAINEMTKYAEYLLKSAEYKDICLRITSSVPLSFGKKPQTFSW
ncbi:hypothetical protein A1353_09600 [Methylomonas methanica]|uniref:Apea-like HEPN domain-containing protein n=2 Tax=Methylomonas methanica TaxID=421 RepID=A0A177MKI9_METMH|nr:hypothetical protein A1353_09600 [Methylomonas methanica]